METIAYKYRLEDHQRRIEDLDTSVAATQATLARIESKLDHLSETIDEWKAESRRSQETLSDISTRVAILESKNIDRAYRAALVKKWISGIVAAVISAAIITWLNLR